MEDAERSHVEVRDLRPDESAAAVALLARGMADNPLNVAAYGDRSEQGLKRMFAARFRVFGSARDLVAVENGVLVGVAGSLPAGTCQATALQRVRFLPAIIAIGPSTAKRVVRWLAAWAEQDPITPHSHLGPVAVEPELRGLGVGSALMREYCRRLDETGEASYLETDKAENVPFYERHGYAVIAEADVLGVRNWFMLREPADHAVRSAVVGETRAPRIAG